MSDVAVNSSAEAGIGTLKRSLAIANKRGLHARAAAKFVRTAGQFDAIVRVSFKGQEVSGLSIMGLMMLAAGQGSKLRFSVRGKDAVALLGEMEALFARKFDES